MNLKAILILLMLNCFQLAIGQSLYPYSIDALNITSENKSLLHSLFDSLNNVPANADNPKDLDSLKDRFCIFNRPEISKLKNSLGNDELTQMIYSDEPLLYTIGFWFYSERIRNQQKVLSYFRYICRNKTEDPESFLIIYCFPYVTDADKRAPINYAPNICFDMVTHQYEVWKNCTKLTGKYLKRAERTKEEFARQLDKNFLEKIVN